MFRWFLAIVLLHYITTSSKKMSKILKVFLVAVAFVLIMMPLVIFRSNASSLGESYLFLGSMQTDVGTDMIGLFTPGSNFTVTAESKEFRIYFPESEGAWCKDEMNTVGNLSVSPVGLGESPIDQGDWSIDQGLPGTLVATCYQGVQGANDYIAITGIDNLSQGQSYGFKIDENTNVFKTGPNVGSNLISYQLIEADKTETLSFSIALLSNDKIIIGAYVVDTDTITCSVGDNVNLGTLYLGGSYVTGNHSLGVSSSGTGFYWTVRGQNAGLAHTSEDAVLSSLGVGGIVDLIAGEGFGLVISSSTLGTIQPNYLSTTPGEFGEIDTDANLILMSDNSGTGAYNITLGARASISAVSGPYQESLTYVCGGYIESPTDYTCYLMQANQVQGISIDDKYNYTISCSHGFDWETVTADDVLKDNITGLYWSKPSPDTLTHAGAITYCDELDLEERTDWRIPTKDELMQISPAPCTVSECAGSYSGNNMNSYNSAFTTTHWFWSLNEVEENTDEAWTLGLYNGYVFSSLKTSAGTARVRCVARD